MISDFMTTEGWDKPLGILARRHEVLAVRVYDPLEVELPDIGMAVFEDAETGEQILIDAHHPEFRLRFALAVQQRRYELNTVFNRLRVDWLSLSTADDLVREMVRFSRKS